MVNFAQDHHAMTGHSPEEKCARFLPRRAEKLDEGPQTLLWIRNRGTMLDLSLHLPVSQDPSRCVPCAFQRAGDTLSRLQPAAILKLA
jgi:hypothetical protein